MSAITIILIILFFVVLALKPTYLLTYGEIAENTNGYVFCETPLITAIVFKILFNNRVQILSSKQYYFALDLYNQKIKEAEQKKEENQDDIEDFD